MYFQDDMIVDISNMINKAYPIYAHMSNNKYEKLEEHTLLALKYFKNIFQKKNLENIFLNMENIMCQNLSKQSKIIFREMMINTITFHDMGKVNAYFQSSRLHNNLHVLDAAKFNNSHHSMLSAIVYIQHYWKVIKNVDRSEVTELLHIMMMNAYVISRHHGELDSWEQFKEKFCNDGEGKKLIEEYGILYKSTLNMELKISTKKINCIFKCIDDNIENQTVALSNCKYIYVRLMLSMLVACDFYATSEFMDGMEITDIGIINNIDEFYNQYKNGDVYKSIRNYENEKYGKCTDFSHIEDINIMRDELFLDAEKNLGKNICGNIFYLEAPTGSGKSNVATNLSFKLLQQDKSKNKIFYVYPFNTLVQQNINNMEKIFADNGKILDKIAVINSIEPIKTERNIIENEDKNQIEYYKKALLNRQFLNYPMVLTTHVTMFSYLFGTQKEDIFPLHQLCNSVIVLDEIQSYKNSIWSEIITFLSSYANILNIKFIIMSATLPDLKKLSMLQADTVRLIEHREKYFYNHLFKDRVKVNFDLLKSDDVQNQLYEHVLSNAKKDKKILIEFINKKSAYEFYHRLKEADDIHVDVELISGDDNLAERDRIISKISKSHGMILVATQVVEAGVDIDMDIGYKDISLLDSEEQFLGRINRSCKKGGCIVYFFNLDDSRVIYKGDIRMNNDVTLANETMQNVLLNKDFGGFYDEIIKRLKDSKEKENDNNIEGFFRKTVGGSHFQNVEKKMELIDDSSKKISVYLNNDIVVNDEAINGEELWNQYSQMLKDNNMNYAEKRVKLSRITCKMNNFIYEIRWEPDFPYNDRIGELYYIEDGEQYFRDGKLDKNKFQSGVGVFI